MSEELTATTIIEQPNFEDSVAARGEALTRMCLAAAQMKEGDAKQMLLRAAERVIASIPVAESRPGSVTTLKGSKTL